jgi:hypothetical protein
MPVGATFQDSQGTDFLGQQQSIMQRAQSRRIQHEQNEMDKQKFQAFLPAIIAQREAEIVSAKAAVDNAAQMEMFKAKAAANSVDYNNRFQNLLSLSDPNERSKNLAAFQSEVAWMSVLPEYKGFVDTVNNERAGAFTMAITNLRLDEALERARQTSAAGVVKEEIRAGARVTSTDTRAASAERIAQINADTKLSVEDKRGRIQAERQGATLADLQSRAAQADQAAADAAAGGDERAAAAHRQAAASYRDAITTSTTDAGYAPSAPRDATQDPRPSPKTSAPSEPIRFNMNDGSAPPAVAPAQKLYVVDPASKTPSFSPEVKTPQDILASVQQMVTDGALDRTQARAMLIKLGFRPKQ